MRVGCVCSGIGAAAVAWKRLGWSFAFHAEIDPFCNAVLAHHHGEIPNRGDFTAIPGSAGPVDVLVGGTPCQGFSVAGLRRGLDDDRSNLALGYLRLADRLRPRWLVWENVPGVLSSNGGRDFGAFLGGLEELGYGWAYRVLDAQYFGVPQRRRRVFVVGHPGDWRRAAAVLFERHSLLGDPPPRREAGSEVARCVANGTNPHRYDGDSENFVAHTLRAEGFDASEDGTGRGTPIIPVPFIVNAAESCARESHARPSETARCLDSTGSFASAQGGTVVVRIEPTVLMENGSDVQAGGMPHLRDGHGVGVPSIADGSAVRRLTPRECERLMGFPDDYTLLPASAMPSGVRKRIRGRDREESLAYLMAAGCTPDRAEALVDCPDGPRYRALGNSIAIPVLEWIGRRIDMVEAHP